MDSRLTKFFEALGVFDQVPSDARRRGPVSKGEQAQRSFKIPTTDRADYKPAWAITASTAPRGFLIWAQSGICENRTTTEDV